MGVFVSTSVVLKRRTELQSTWIPFGKAWMWSGAAASNCLKTGKNDAIAVRRRVRQHVLCVESGQEGAGLPDLLPSPQPSWCLEITHALQI